MEIKENFDLKHFNTFSVPAKAKYFATVQSEEDIEKLWSKKEFTENSKLFLGGGSNILFTKDFEGIVILNKIQGIEILTEDNNSVTLRSGAGESWHDLVKFTVEKGWWGLENLSYIPGSVGGAPVQNIGAYGAEMKDVLETVEGYDLSGSKSILKNSECGFGYRDSVFKNRLKGKYLITAVTLKLSKKPKPNTSYKILSDYLSLNNIEVKTPKDVSEAVTNIRKSKLPDPKEIGNAGSFFKNAYVSEEKQQELLKVFPEMPFFKETQGYKIPSGWLVESAGFKGQKFGNVGIYEKQALVLVNNGGATGGEVFSLAQKIQDSVYAKFGILLEMEVNLI